jgi:hypothetical protein
MARTESTRSRDSSFGLLLITNLWVSIIFFYVLFGYSYLVGLPFYLSTLELVIAIVWGIVSMGIIYYRLGRNPPPAPQSQQKG